MCVNHEILRAVLRVLNHTDGFGEQADRLTTIDPKALNHVLANPMTYYKPAHLRLTLGQLIGEGKPIYPP